MFLTAAKSYRYQPIRVSPCFLGGIKCFVGEFHERFVAERFFAEHSPHAHVNVNAMIAGKNGHMQPFP